MPGGGRWRRDALRRRFLAGVDLITGTILAGACLAAVQEVPVLPWAPLVGLLFVPVAKLGGLYDRDHRAIHHLTVDELGPIALSIGAYLAMLAVSLNVFFSDHPRASALVAIWAAGTILMVSLRGLARYGWRKATAPERTALIGHGLLAASVRNKLELYKEVHIELCEERLVLESLNGNRTAALRELARKVDRIILAQPSLDNDLAAELATICRAEQTKLSVVSPLSGGATPRPRMSSIAHLPVLEFETADVSRATLLIKRTMDVAIASAALLVLLPLYPLVALAIKLDSRGSVIYRQLRAGKDGKAFWMLKLRTMQRDAEELLPTLVRFDELEEPVFKVHADPRVTRVGRLLRRFSLDELPQLINVLRGEMSLVGPRPEQVDLVERYRPDERVGLNLKPGMTGPMQIFGRAALPFSSRINMEAEYVQNLSVGRDLRILIQTIPATLRGRGAY